MCKRVFVLHKGESVYDGNFNTLINNVNPKRKLVFEFSDLADKNSVDNLLSGFEYNINGSILTSFLPEEKLQLLLKILLKNFSASNISFEDLPVDETMKTFFENPSKYLK